MSTADTPMREPRLPLSVLIPDPENVRQTAASPTEDRMLKATIKAAGGLLQNLVVRQAPARGDTRGKYYVTAGGRRLQALRELAAEGVINADAPIRCYELPRDANPATISLAENISRSTMQPVDQYRAFAMLVDQGSTIEKVATHFGVSERTVERRLRLGNVAEDILKAFGEDRLTLKTLEAFATTTDQSRQLAVFKRHEQALHTISPYVVRNDLTHESVPASSALAVFVGEAAYVSAGGAIDRDLFDSPNDSFWADRELVHSLAYDKLRERASTLKDQWKWVETRLQMPANYRLKLGTAEGRKPKLRAAARQAMEAATTELDAVSEDTALPAEEQIAKIAEINRRLADLQQAETDRTRFTKAQRDISGCLVTIGAFGTTQVVYGLIKPEDMPEEAAAASPAQDQAADAGEPGRNGGTTATARSTGSPAAGTQSKPGADAGAAGRATDTPPAVRGPAKTSTPQAEVRARTGIGPGLMDDLRGIRSSAAKLAISRDPETAFNLIAWQVAYEVFVGSPVAAPLNMACQPTDGTPATRASDQHYHQWNTVAAELADRSDLPLDAFAAPRESSFRQFCALPRADRERVMAAAVGATLRVQLGIDDGISAEQEEALRQTGASLGEGFRSHPMFWLRVRKEYLIDTAEEVFGRDYADQLAGLDRDARVAAIHDAFTSPTAQPVWTDGALERARVWAPPGFKAGDIQRDPGDETGRTDDDGPTDAPTAAAPATANGSAGRTELPAFMQDA